MKIIFYLFWKTNFMVVNFNRRHYLRAQRRVKWWDSFKTVNKMTQILLWTYPVETYIPAHEVMGLSKLCVMTAQLATNKWLSRKYLNKLLYILIMKCHIITRKNSKPINWKTFLWILVLQAKPTSREVYTEESPL